MSTAFQTGRRSLPDLMTPAEVADALRVTQRTVARYGDSGRITRVVLSERASRYTADSVRRLMDAASPTNSIDAADNGADATNGQAGPRDSEG